MDSKSFTDRAERDFARDAWCILGLPFDNCSIGDICGIIDDCVENKYSRVFSTPNLNWVIESTRDIGFKEAVIKSDVSVIDGWPVLWVSRLLGLPIENKAPGSALIEHILSKKGDRPYRLFFFGGEKGVAEEASRAVNAAGSKIRAVGHCYPGHGTIDEMSGDNVIRGINEARPDILLVSLGAKKGVSWIEKNRPRINAKFLAHFGAVINFIAGRVKRAPAWAQKIGAEWLWRIAQEPSLAARYLKDGFAFVCILIGRVIPCMIFMSVNRRYSLVKEEPFIETGDEGPAVRIKIEGVCNHLNAAPVRRHFKECAIMNKDVMLDLSGAVYVDNLFLGLLLVLLKYKLLQRKKLYIVNPTQTLNMALRFNLLNDILKPERRT